MENNKKDSVVLGFVVLSSIIIIGALGFFQLGQSIVCLIRLGFNI